MSNKLAKSRNGRSILARDPFGIDQFFNDLWGGHNDFWNLNRHRPIQDVSSHHPITSQKNEDGSLSLFVEVPGFAKEDLAISYNEDTGLLSIASNSEEKSETTFQKRSISYQYAIKGYDPETIEATCEKGILTIKALPCSVKDNVRIIEIK